MGQASSCRQGCTAVPDTNLCCSAGGETVHPLSIESPSDEDELLHGVPRELAEAVRSNRQWHVLRWRQWLSPSAFQGLQRSLHQCELPGLAQRYREAELALMESPTFVEPPVTGWEDLDEDHFVTAGQVFRRDAAGPARIAQMRRAGFQAIRRGKVGVVLLAGGANLRLNIARPPVSCCASKSKLLSGKSIIQLLCERIRRLVSLCQQPEPIYQSSRRATWPLLSIPLLVMTSRLTHQTVVEHFEAHGHFGLLPRDVLFFEQPVWPVLNKTGGLLPQSLGGEFAHLPGGTGEVFAALARSGALEQMRDRGVESLSVLGTENVLARVCDPVFVGFCREHEIDCACKTVRRNAVDEDLELFCVRQRPVSSQYADVEEVACGILPEEAPSRLLVSRNDGDLRYTGCINAYYFTVRYIEEIMGRPCVPHRVQRVVPYLDFHLLDADGELMLGGAAPDGMICMRQGRPVFAGGESDEEDPFVSSPSRGKLSGIALGSWPLETAASTSGMIYQRVLLSSAAEVRSSVGQDELRSLHDAWRCDVHLDVAGSRLEPRARTARRSTTVNPRPLVDGACDNAPAQLGCSFVLPCRPNAIVLESRCLDYFAYTDRAIAFEVSRKGEYASVREPDGLDSADHSRQALSTLHFEWLLGAGWTLKDMTWEDADLEISPLLSFEGEGLEPPEHDPMVPSLPYHMRSPCELNDAEELTASWEAGTGVDTRQYYLQEYPRRPVVSRSPAPQFMQPGGV